MFDQLIISKSGIRGVVGRGLTPDVAACYGAAFGTYLKNAGAGPGYIAMGRDSRTSGAMLADATAAGLRSTGWTVKDAGLAPTPTIMLAVQDSEQARGGVVVTASHNPIEWNGLKLAGEDGLFLRGDAGELVQQAFEEGPARVDWSEIGAREPLPGAVDHHIDRVLALDYLDRAAIAARRPVVALDCVRGIGGVIMPRLLAELGCQVRGIGLEPDGRFPRNPEPLPENLSELGALVRDAGADLGMAVDPDGDRLALVDASGRPVGEEATLVLAAALVLSKRQGPVVTNLSTSRSIEEVAGVAGVRLHRAPVGEANVAARMIELDAVIGGEGNGGVMLPDLHLTRDAPVAAALVLQLLAESDASLEQLVARWPRYSMVKRRAPRPGGELEPAYEALERAADGEKAVDRSDGLRIDWPQRREWVHIRPSGTEPIVRIIAEAEQSERAEELVDWAIETFNELT